MGPKQRVVFLACRWESKEALRKGANDEGNGNKRKSYLIVVCVVDCPKE
jgi:hypothetical protein